MTTGHYAASFMQHLPATLREWLRQAHTGVTERKKGTSGNARDNGSLTTNLSRLLISSDEWNCRRNLEKGSFAARRRLDARKGRSSSLPSFLLLSSTLVQKLDSSVLFVFRTKVALICPNIGMVYSGMGPDFRVLVAKARKSAQAYWKIYGEYPSTRVMVGEIATVMQDATQSGYVTTSSCFLYSSIESMRVLTIRKPPSLEEFDHSEFPSWSPGSTTQKVTRCTKLTLQVRSGRGRRARLARTKSTRKLFSKNG